MISRRLTGALLAGLLLATPAVAQDNFPTKPIRMVVAFAVGGSSDILPRLLAVEMAAELAQIGQAGDVRGEVDKWMPIVKASGAKPD